MADPVVEIEAQLRRPVTLATANDQRAKLNQRFTQLSADQAAILLTRILTLDGDRLPADFRRLDRAVRLELLLKLVGRMGVQASAKFAAQLGSGGSSTAVDPKLQKGLDHVFPPHTKPQRDKFLRALATGAPTGIPSVLLTFRADDKPLSPDNQCPSRTLKTGQSAVPNRLGLDPDPSSGLNWMEIRGTVSNHRPDAQYQFRRTIEKAKWYRTGANAWKCLEYWPPGTDDDATDTDEDTHPDNDHIYVIDSPGFINIPPDLDSIPRDDRPKVVEYVFMMNALEMVDVKVGSGPWTKAGSLEWFSVTWLEKSGNVWRRKPGNKIAQGSISDMEIAATTGQPPTSY